MQIPHDYEERVYAGVLGKIIGVYLGRPFEGWSYERIMAELGEIAYYVHERHGVPLIVTDDDISGTFTFLRALPDHGNSRRSWSLVCGGTGRMIYPGLARVESGFDVIGPGELPKAHAIRRRVRLESGRPDGRCGKVAEAIAAELGWAYPWGHLRLLDGGICWIHCWNQLPDGIIVDATADQFEERGLSDVAVLSPSDPLQA